jgi:hypothetical protein
MFLASMLDGVFPTKWQNTRAFLHPHSSSLPAFFLYFAVSYGYGKYVNDESVGTMDRDAPLSKVDLLPARKLLPRPIQDLRMKPFIILAFVACCTVPIHAFREKVGAGDRAWGHGNFWRAR